MIGDFNESGEASKYGVRIFT